MHLKSILFSLMLGALFFSCQQKKNGHADDMVFRYNEHANITSLDPAFAKDQRNIWAVNQLYNRLVRLDDSLNIEPDLAEGWQTSEDGLTYIFKLRPDVYYHKNRIFGKDSTRTVRASDVVYSLQRLTDPKIASPGSWVMRDVDSLIALDNQHVKIKLKKPFPAFLGLLSMNFCSILPTEMELASFHTNPVGTGPFQFKRWKANEKLVFRKNPLYFEKDGLGNRLPYLEAVAITFLPEKQSEFMQFSLGKLDFISGLDATYKDELLTSTGQLHPKYADRVKMKKSPYLNMEYIGINLAYDSLENRSIPFRKALNFGFDRQKMITYLRNGIGIPAESGFIPEGLPGHSDSIYYSYQPRKAKALITQFKKESHIQVPQLTLATTAQYLDLCEFLQKEWQKIGVEVKIDVMPASTLLQKRASGQLQAFRASWIADYPDAENYLSLFYSPNFAPNGPNYTHFQSDEFDRLYERAGKTPDINQRKDLYQQMDGLIMQDAAVVPLYYDEVVRFIGQNVKGLGINPQNLLDLRYTQKTPPTEN